MKRSAQFSKHIETDELAAIERCACEASLATFVQTFWSAVEPANKLVWGDIIDAVCVHLQSVTEGKTRRLIINVPPGCTKSLTTNVFWPAWEWGPRNMPHMRYISASYSVGLTERDNQRLLQVVLSPLYRYYWGDRFSITHQGVTKVQNDKTGWKLATSVGGIGTGERADRVLIDDANNVKDVESDAVRNSTNQWLTEVMPSRLNVPARSAIVNIQQRTHEEDATGTLLAGPEDWTHLMIPMRYDPGRRCETEIGWEDWRSEEGELAWPQRFPEREVKLLAATLGPYAESGQLQQSPSPRGGGIIRYEWWQEWEPKESPPASFILGSLDTAIKEGEQNDYYAVTYWIVWHDPETETPKMLMLYGWKERAPLSDICGRVVKDCRKLKVDRLVIEDKSHGWVAQQEIRKLMKGWKFSIFMFDPRRYGDKTARLLSVQHLFSEGLIYAPVADDGAGNITWRKWADPIITNVCSFPRVAHDDETDSVSMALRHLRDIGFALRKEEHSRSVYQRDVHKSRLLPLYPV